MEGRFGLSFYEDGKRKRRYHKTEEARDLEIKRLRQQAENEGLAGEGVAAEDLVLLSRFREIVGQRVSLIEVAHYWAAGHCDVEAMDFATAAELFAIYRTQSRRH